MESPFEQARRDVEQSLSRLEFAASLRELAEAIEQRTPFAIAVDGKMIVPPLDAALSIEHEQSGSEEELEFQLKWVRQDDESTPADATAGPEKELREAGHALS